MDELKKKLRTPEDDAADAARAKQEAEAEGKRAVAEVRKRASRMFREAQSELAAKLLSGSVSVGYGDQGHSLTIYDKTLWVDTAEEGNVLVVKRTGGNSTRLVFNKSGYGLVREDSPQAPLNAEEFIGDEINALVTSAKGS